MSKDLSSSVTAPTAAVDTPSLLALSPLYDESRHLVYVDMLVRALEQKGSTAPRNIALAGHYGSGKSSVIQGMVDRLTARKPISISLSSLGPAGLDSDPGEQEGSAENRVTNRIQKEIVKQLLYREPPARMRASKYRRIQPFRWWPGLAWMVACEFLVIAGVTLLGRPQRLADDWNLLALAAALAGCLVLVGQWRFKGRFWLDKISAGPASVTLTGTSDSYFDDYLDEIVYFFTVSKCRVVVFEDLDRFNDAHIFETLRGLNTILSSAKQLGDTDDPIRFVYAVRDSIFDLLDAESGADTGAPVEEPSTSRTKFFDLVVPIVPFITYRTSHELIEKEMEGTAFPPSAEVVKLVGAHITDMRLIRNIRNEYEVFQAHVLPPQGLDGLKPDQLFAMMVYKNTRLSDFEKIKTGDSLLDEVYNAYRRLVNEQIGDRQQKVRELSRRLDASALTPDRSVERGQRLESVVLMICRAMGYTHHTSVQVQLRANGNPYTLDQAGRSSFWQDVLAADGSMQVFYPNGTRDLLKDQLEVILGEELHANDWEKNARELMRADITTAETEIAEIHSSSLSTILARTDLTVTSAHGAVDLNTLADRLLGAPLAVGLLRAGYIDQNFALYVAQYYGLHLGPSAMNFILHVTQQRKQDPGHHFDSTDDIDALIGELGPEFLAEDSAYNLEIVDHLLATNSKLLKPLLFNLTRSGEGDRAFLDSYMTSGRHRELLLSRLSRLWSDVFVYIDQVSTTDESELARWLDAALSGAVTDRQYFSNDEVREAIDRLSGEIAVLSTPGTSKRSPQRVARVLAGLGVVFSNLTQLDAEIRKVAIRWDVYRVNRTNLMAALDSQGADLSLDTLAAADQSVYQQVLHNLGDYAEILTDDPQLHSISDPRSFVKILKELSEAALRPLRVVLDRAAPGCLVDDLREVPAPLWPEITAALRCASSMANLAAYLEVYDLDKPVARLLTDGGSIDGAESAPENERTSIAVRILNSEFAPLDSLKGLLTSLNVAVSAENASRSIGPVIPDLVAAGLLSDDRFAFERIDPEDWETKKRLISISSAFVEYLPELNLTDQDLTQLMKGVQLPREVRAAVLSGSVSLAELTPAGANVVMVETLAADLPVADSALIALAQAGGGPELLLALLHQHADIFPADRIFDVLASMPAPYRNIPQSSEANPVQIPIDARPLFDRLAKDGLLLPLKKVPRKGLLLVRRNQ